MNAQKKMLKQSQAKYNFKKNYLLKLTEVDLTSFMFFDARNVYKTLVE
jgi:hypothetical protein